MCFKKRKEESLAQSGGAGFNCAEAVNFGPPDWLPWGTYVADKYRREGRSATLSHDALLIALVTAAPDVSARLEREAKVSPFFSSEAELGCLRLSQKKASKGCLRLGTVN